MCIFELVLPGTHINFIDRELSWKFEHLLYHLESAFYEANISLNLFEAEVSKQTRGGGFSREKLIDDFKKRQAMEEEVRREFGLQPYERHEEVMFEADARIKREKWRSGQIPTSHRNQLISIYAKSFIYALDTIDKFLGVISKEEGAPAGVADAQALMGKYFPDLRKVRNSAQHLEDRARGLGAGKQPKPLDLKPVDNGFVSAPQGALMLNNILGTKYGCTMADGNYGEVDVSVESLKNLQIIVQSAFNSFDWLGIRQHLPR